MRIETILTLVWCAYSFLTHRRFEFNRPGEKIMSKNDRFVMKHGSNWAVKKGGVARPEGVHHKQSDAERSAKSTVHNLGGGDGRWRDSDTVAPGHDPFPARDRRHR